LTGSTVFFAYSHRDEGILKELHAHLAMLEREGLIATWHDRCISAGSDIDDTIAAKLNEADITMLLVSAQFLASDYCYNVEMNRALQRHDKGQTRVIPVIARPCDWKHAPFGHLRATPKDGRPITSFGSSDEALTEIAADLRRVIAEIHPSGGAAARAASLEMAARRPAAPPITRPAALRLARNFTDREKDDFLEAAFAVIADHFKAAMQEVHRSNPSAEGRFKSSGECRFDATVYVQGNRLAQCRIWFNQDAHRLPGIGYAVNPSPNDNTYNERLSVSDDGQELALTAEFAPIHGVARPLSPVEAAEHLWRLFSRDVESRRPARA